MSRTYKDKPYKLKPENSWKQDKEYFPAVFSEEGVASYSFFLDLPTTKPKKRKEKDSEDHWMSTPSWWTKMTMIKPERRAAHLLEVNVLKAADIEEFDFPDLGKKPHIYFY